MRVFLALPTVLECFAFSEGPSAPGAPQLWNAILNSGMLLAIQFEFLNEDHV